MQLMTQSVCI